MIFCGFSTKASIGLSYVIDIFIIFTLFFAETFFTVFIMILTLIIFLGFAYLGQKKPPSQDRLIIEKPWCRKSETWLRVSVLFMGVLSSIISILDMLDDLVFRTVEDSDGYQFATKCLYFVPPVVVGLSWTLLGIIFILGALYSALKLFPRSS
jgi:Peptidase M50B-like